MGVEEFTQVREDAGDTSGPFQSQVWARAKVSLASKKRWAKARLVKPNLEISPIMKLFTAAMAQGGSVLKCHNVGKLVRRCLCPDTSAPTSV